MIDDDNRFSERVHQELRFRRGKLVSVDGEKPSTQLRGDYEESGFDDGPRVLMDL